MDFQDGGHLGFPIRMILAILIYKSSRCFLPNFQSIGLSVQKKRIYRCSRWPPCHLGFPILAIFELQVTLLLPTKFRVNWPFSSGEAKNKFSRWRPWWPSWISDRNDFSYFLSNSQPDAFYRVSWPRGVGVGF